MWEVCGVRVESVDEVCAAGWDALVSLTGEGVPPLQALEDFVAAHHDFDHASKERGCVSVVRCPRVCGGRLVLAAAGGGAGGEYEGAEALAAAAAAGVRRALAAGARRVLLAPRPHARHPRAALVQLLGALEALYVPLQVRESCPERALTASALGVYAEGVGAPAPLLRAAVALERGRVLARDVGGADPERMTSLRAAEHIAAALQGTPVRVTVLDDAAQIAAQYPLFAAVTRAANAVPRHRGCIVFLEYEPAEYDRTLMFVGKGVTYDTGGADVKTGGCMAGMSRDKCGAATAAGLFVALAALGARVKAVAALGFARNSIGEESYVSDEVLVSRRGVPVRVGNTDAEGRLVMADLLAELAERAAGERRPHLYTLATLTGHAARAVGRVSVAMDNQCARSERHALKLQALGELVGEPLEESLLRYEDFAAHQGRGPGEGLYQAAPQPSVALARGHQGPAAFLLLAGGVERGAVPCTLLDIAGAAGELPAPPTAQPLLTLAALAGLLPDC